MQCSVKTCERKVLARGWCSMHYQSWRAWGHPEGSAPAKIPSRCEREGCPRPASAKGLCSMHYAQLRRSRTTCSEEGCTKGLQAKGLCAMHYRRQRMAGTTCAVEDCVKVCQAGGLCSAHYKRKMKHGDPLLGGRVLVNDGPCSEEGCEKTAATRGLWEGHQEALQVRECFCWGDRDGGSPVVLPRCCCSPRWGRLLALALRPQQRVRCDGAARGRHVDRLARSLHGCPRPSPNAAA